MRQTALAAYAHQDMPFANLVTELKLDRDPSYSPLSQVMFNVINVPMPMPRLHGVEFELLEIDRGASQFDLSTT